MDRPYAELEIGLHRLQAESYQVELRFNNPASEAETAPHRGPCQLDPQALTAFQLDPRAYGERLTSQLFSDEKALAYFQRTKTAVETADLSLRVRLLVGATAQELHALRWELLVDPDTKAPLATSEK